MNIINNRKADNLRARMEEFLSFSSADSVADMFNRAFEAGVAAKSDADYFAMRDALERARARYEAQRRTEPVAFFDVAPGTLIRIATNAL
jgi:hypothetical protein